MVISASITPGTFSCSGWWDSGSRYAFGGIIYRVSLYAQHTGDVPHLKGQQTLSGTNGTWIVENIQITKADTDIALTVKLEKSTDNGNIWVLVDSDTIHVDAH